MSKLGRLFLGFCMILILSGGYNIVIAEAPQITLSQLRNQESWTSDDILLGIRLLTEEYQFPYFSLLKDLAIKESRLGQDKRCGDGGKSCGLYQWRKPTWEQFQKKYHKEYLDYNNSIDQIEMTIIALKDGYWYLWGPLKRKYKTNPIH